MLFIVFKILLYLSQVLALFFGIKNRVKNKDSKQRYFMHFMIYVLIHEIVAYLLLYHTALSNYFVYNSYIIISFIFYFHWFSKILKLKKGFILFAALLFLISVIYSINLGTFYTRIWHYPMLVGTISILIFVSILFAEMLNSKDVINFKQSQKFWFAIGLLIFYIGYLPFTIFQDYIQSYSIDYNLLLAVLNILLYSSFAKGFTCKIKN